MLFEIPQTTEYFTFRQNELFGAFACAVHKFSVLSAMGQEAYSLSHGSGLGLGSLIPWENPPKYVHDFKTNSP